MSLLSDLNPVSALIKVGSDIIDRVIPDKNAAAQAKAQLDAAAQTGELQKIMGQLAINQEEAKSTNWFVAGWRPFVGWICGSALAYHFILLPFMMFLATIFWPQHPTFPQLDIGQLMTVLMGMLGLGGLRTFEKTKGVARS